MTAKKKAPTKKTTKKNQANEIRRPAPFSPALADRISSDALRNGLMKDFGYLLNRGDKIGFQKQVSWKLNQLWKDRMITTQTAETNPFGESDRSLEQ